jgi:hypothetical protein
VTVSAEITLPRRRPELAESKDDGPGGTPSASTVSAVGLPADEIGPSPESYRVREPCGHGPQLGGPAAESAEPAEHRRCG